MQKIFKNLKTYFSEYLKHCESWFLPLRGAADLEMSLMLSKSSHQNQDQNQNRNQAPKRLLVTSEAHQFQKYQLDVFADRKQFLDIYLLDVERFLSCFKYFHKDLRPYFDKGDHPMFYKIFKTFSEIS